MSRAAPDVGYGRLQIDRPRLGRMHGHDIIHDKDGVTRYCDDLSPVDRSSMRPCPFCRLSASDYDGQDPCIAGLPGVCNACCGHGVDEPYAQLEDGTFLIGERYLSLLPK